MTDMLRGPTPSGSPLAVPSPHLLPPPLRPPSVDLHALDDDPVDVLRLIRGDVLVPDVRKDKPGIPLQRRTPSAASPAAKADLLAPDELEPSDLAGDHRLPAMLETMQVFGVPSVPPSTPQGGYMARPTDTVK